jgi:large subunit ribosomal protein L24
MSKAFVKKGDIVKVIAGGQKGKEGKVEKVTIDKVYIEKVNIRERHVKPTQVNPRGGKKDVNLGIAISNVKVVTKAAEPTKATKKVAKKTTAKKGAK